MSVTYLTLEEFSEKHPGFTVPTLRRMVRDKQIDYLQPRGKGGTIYIPDDALERLVVRASTEMDVVDAADVVNAPTIQPRRRSGRMPDWKRKL